MRIIDMYFKERVRVIITFLMLDSITGSIFEKSKSIKNFICNAIKAG